jgi:Fur family zinc uptake transcriptional regulator
MDVKKAIKLLKKKGYKTTGRRKDILTYFQNEDGYRTAKDLLQFMENKYKGISPDTVYRNLHLYDSMKILESTELNGEKHFRMNCTTHHHHHFICNECGNTEEIEFCPMDKVENSLPNFQIEDHKFEIYGLCPGCQTA